MPKFKVVGLTVNCSVGLTPVPVREMVIGEPGALLVRVMLALAAPVAVGAKVTAKLELLPALMVSGTVRPLIVKAPDEIVAWVIVRLAVPEFVKLIVSEALLPVFTLPKVTLDGVAVSCG